MKTYEKLIMRGMCVKDIPEQPRQRYIPMAHGFADDAVSADEFTVFIWTKRSDYNRYPTYMYGWEVHRNGLWIGNSEHRLISRVIAWDSRERAEAAAREYIDRVVKFGVNHETP